MSASLHFAEALLPGGWARDVRIGIADGCISRIETGVAAQPSDERHPVALPGLPNIHSHAFQRGMAGLAERRGARRQHHRGLESREAELEAGPVEGRGAYHCRLVDGLVAEGILQPSDLPLIETVFLIHAGQESGSPHTPTLFELDPIDWNGYPLGGFLARDEKDEAVAVVKLLWIVDVCVVSLAFVIVFVTAPLVAPHLTDDPSSTELMRVYAAAMLLGGLDATAGSILRVFDRFRLSFLTGACGTVGSSF